MMMSQRSQPRASRSARLTGRNAALTAQTNTTALLLGLPAGMSAAVKPVHSRVGELVGLQVQAALELFRVLFRRVLGHEGVVLHSRALELIGRHPEHAVFEKDNRISDVV